MNQQQAKEFWPLIKQWSEGGVLQGRHSTGWVSLDYPLFDSALNYREHSLDHGKTWLPCGVMEET